MPHGLKGKPKSEKHKIALRNAKLKNPVKYWLGKKRPSMVGKNNPLWKGGRSRSYKIGYYSTEYKNWRMKVFERDGFRCQCCGVIGVYLTAHHIKSFAHFPKLRFELDNGITLCEPCHSLTDNYKGRNKVKGKLLK